MYGTGQYDYQILQALQSILSVVEGISTMLSSVIDNWFPITVGAILLLCAISLVKWLVKI